VTAYTCGCTRPTLERTNQSTGDKLLLCESHAYLHDWGHGFTVYAEVDGRLWIDRRHPVTPTG